MEELETRAKEIDRIRTSNIRNVSTINQRNRQDNVKRAEDAFKAETAERKKAKADPFTRTRGKPTLVTKSKDPEIDAQIKQRYLDAYKPISTEDVAAEFSIKQGKDGQKTVEDKVSYAIYTLKSPL